MSWVMLLSKRRDFVREMEKEMKMCLWATKLMKFQNKRVREGWKSSLLVCGLVLFI